jgi:hypothetical protein
MKPVFFRTSNYTYNELYIYLKYILYKVEITFPQSLLHYQHIFFTSAWDALCRYHKTLNRSVAALQESCVAGRCRQQNGVLWVHPSGGRKDGNQNVQYRKCQVDKNLIHRPVWPNIFIYLFYFLNICTYRSEQILTPVSKNSANNIPSLFEMTRAMTLRTRRSLHLEFVSLILPTVPL